MTCIIELKSCPSCGHSQLLKPLSPQLRFDNSLEHAMRRGKAINFDTFRPMDYANSGWSVCKNCALIFCQKRPSLDDADKWYEKLFRVVENRNYDIDPLPEIYITNQTSFAVDMFETLDAINVFNNVKSVLHVHCNAGLLLDRIRSKKGVDELYGLEYFEYPTKHAARLIGANRICRIQTPEPVNPFPQEKFDLLLIEHMLTHAHDPIGYLSYLKSLLNVAGKLVVFNELDHAQAMPKWGFYSKGINFFHKQLYTRDSMTAFLQSQGLELVSAPHPDGRKWAVANDAMLFVCRAGKTVAVPVGDVQEAKKLLRNWFQRHRVFRRLRWIAKPLKLWLRRF